MKKEKIIVAVIFLVIGAMFGRFIWGTTNIEWIPVQYDVIKNTDECKKLGGNIAAEFHFYDENYVTFKCVVAEKRIDL